MQTTAQPNAMPIANAKAISHPWLMLISRSVLFMLFQALIALTLFTGLVIKLRPTLLPYFMIVHALMDVLAVAIYLML